jgi:S1-C subfamily serine protease
MRRIALVRSGAWVLAISLAVAGCGGGDASSTTSTPEAESSTTTQESTVTAVGTEGSTEFLSATLTAGTVGEPGVVVIEVAPDSLSRLKVGDVIIACNGDPVATPEELVECGGDPELGGQFTIRVVRGSNRFTLAEVQSPSAFLGTRVKDVPGGKGGRVVEVVSDSPADQAGIKPGDVIIAMDDTAVRNGDDLVQAVADHSPGDEVTVTAVRGSNEVEFSVTLVRNPGLSG